MLTNEKHQSLSRLVDRIYDFYSESIERLKEEQPEALEKVIVNRYCFETEKFVPREKTVLKVDFRHLIDIKNIARLMLTKGTRIDWIFSQSDHLYGAFNRLDSHMKWMIPEINNELGIVNPELAKDIFHSPRFSLIHEFNSKGVSLDDRDTTLEQAVKVLDLISNINDFDGNENFKAIPFTSSYRLGRASNNSYLNDGMMFKSKQFDDQSKSYVDVECNSFTIDSNIALLYTYKNHHSFVVSFFIDQELNVYIRQIQGMHKSKGIPAIGKNWQKKVVRELKDKLTFAKKIYLIDGQSVKNAIVEHYAERYVPEVIEPKLDKAKEIYDELNRSANEHLELKMSHSNNQHPIVSETFHLHFG